ncbi:ammonia-forming cytochrome c nitrite reductase subunit c552, partial [Candidatus Eisenbacteria bacterium]
VEYTYLGGYGAECNHCHAKIVAETFLTAHTRAFARMDFGDRVNPYCLTCHTTGFDSEVAEGDTVIVEYGPDIYGYDDYFLVDTETAATRREMLAGVQCESCHGPMGPNVTERAGRISLATPLEGSEEEFMCGPCHQTQLAEWHQSAHGSVTETLEEFNSLAYVHDPECDYCHVAEGFVAEADADLADYNSGETVHFIGCQICHDPHMGSESSGYERQVRTGAAVTPAYDVGDPEALQMDGYRTGQICAQCHHALPDNEEVTDQITNGSGDFGPHSAPQMDVFVGNGCYEIAGYEYERVHIHQYAPTGCVDCHMNHESDFHGENQEHATHRFEAHVGACNATGCHGPIPDFNYKGIQTEIARLMENLAAALGYADVEAFLDEDTGFDSQGNGVEVWEREAAYALIFVAYDGSVEVHNPDYVRDLLNNAIDHVDDNR